MFTFLLSQRKQRFGFRAIYFDWWGMQFSYSTSHICYWWFIHIHFRTLNYMYSMLILCRNVSTFFPFTIYITIHRWFVQAALYCKSILIWVWKHSQSHCNFSQFMHQQYQCEGNAVPTQIDQYNSMLDDSSKFPPSSYITLLWLTPLDFPPTVFTLLWS